MGSDAKCSVCKKQLGPTWKKIIVRDAEERQRSIQLCTQKTWDVCKDCETQIEQIVKKFAEAKANG